MSQQVLPVPVTEIPREIRGRYEVYDYRHARAISHADFPAEWGDIINVLAGFSFGRSEVVEGGGQKSSIAARLEDAFTERHWQEATFETRTVVDRRVGRRSDPQIETSEVQSRTHKVDCFKNGVALEVEWNSKDSVFDRDLDTFRRLFDLRAVSVGVIVTRGTGLQALLRILIDEENQRRVRTGEDPLKQKYGATTTHMGKLLPKLEGGGGGGCPILVFGITAALHDSEA